MALKRMLAKSISLSKQVNKLSLKHKLIFTWCIAHLDDWGLIENEPEIIKAMVCPLIREISIKDIKEFIVIAKNGEVGLIMEYEDCIEFPGFVNFNTLSEEKRSKSKFSKIPKNPQENFGENNNPQKSPLQYRIGEDRIGEDRIGEDRIGEGEGSVRGEVAAIAASPAQFAQQFFSLQEKQEPVIQFLISKNIPENIAKTEINKFIAYWTEPTRSGKKQRWETEKTFEIKRRLATWFSRIKGFRGNQETKGMTI